MHCYNYAFMEALFRYKREAKKLDETIFVSTTCMYRLVISKRNNTYCTQGKISIFGYIHGLHDHTIHQNDRLSALYPAILVGKSKPGEKSILPQFY